jgi:hypothetical protein
LSGVSPRVPTARPIAEYSSVDRCSRSLAL